jgi:hypothetical protein
MVKMSYRSVSLPHIYTFSQNLISECKVKKGRRPLEGNGKHWRQENII